MRSMFSKYLQHEIEAAIKREIIKDSKDSWESPDDKSWNTPSLEELVQCFQNISTEPKLRKRSFGLFCIRVYRSRTESSVAQALTQIVANSPKRGDSLSFTQEGSFLRIGMMSTSKSKVQFSTHQEWLESNSSNWSAVSHFIPNKFAAEGRIYTVNTFDLRKIAEEEAWDKLADPLVCQTWLKVALGSPSRSSILIKGEFSKFGHQHRADRGSAQYSPSFTSSKSGANSYNYQNNLDSQNETPEVIQVSEDNKVKEPSSSSRKNGQNYDLSSSVSKKKQISFALEPANCSRRSAGGSFASVGSSLSPDLSQVAISVAEHPTFSKERSPHRGTRTVKTTVDIGAVSRDEAQGNKASDSPAGVKRVGQNLEELRANSCSEGKHPSEEDIWNFGGLTSHHKNSTYEPSTNPGSPSFMPRELKTGELAPKLKLGKYALNPRVAWAGKI